MRSKCYVHRRQRLAASTAKDQGGWDTVGEENGRTGRRPARTRVAGPRRMSLGAAMLLVIVLGPALDVRQRPSTSVSGSEFPERECCDPVYPPMPDPEPVPGPAYPTTTISTSSSFQTGQSGMGGGGLLGGSGGIGGAGGGSTAVGNELGGGLIGTGSGSQLSSSRPMHIGYSGSNIKTAIAILNCILARQLCFEDPSCSAILEIIPRVCGPVPVACSTVTVTKCQAALRTLQAFPFFRPTCLCKEPGMDPDCNYFRDFLFDHPCGFVSKKEKDPYPVDALPTCNHALSVCQQERKCIKLFEDFKLHCKVRENKCRMEDRDLCYEAWTNLRLSPMFGCICPNNHMKRRCDKIFSVVNHNPCVDVLPSALDTSSGTATNSIYPNFFPSDIIEDPPPTSTYPYFLFPSKKYPPSAFGSAIYHATVDYINLPDGPGSSSPANGTNAETDQSSSSFSSSSSSSTNSRQHPGTEHNYRTRYEHNFDTSMHHTKHQSPTHSSSNNAPIAPSWPDQHQHQHQQHQYRHGENGTTDPTGHVGMGRWDSMSVPSDLQQQPETVGSDDIEEKEAEMSFIHFQSTCHLALDSCRDDQVCSSALKTVLMHCDQHRCNRNACMESLQSFYKSIHDDLSLDIAFCLCRKTPNRHDSCMIAQEKLHPVCAQRPPESLSQQSSSTGNGIAYNAPPACHAVAELCREDEDCRARLEVFEQSCAVDSVTKKCAGKTSACRQAMLGILGTPLRTTCACQGSDMQQLYDCLGWQRLLWLNPCVVESQKDFHLKRLAELGLLTTTTTMATTTTTIATTTTLRTTRVTQPPTPPPTKPKPVYRPKPTEMHTVESNYVETPDTRPETLVHNQNGVIERSDIDRGHQHPPPDEYDRSTGTRHQSVDSDSEDDMTGQYGKEIYQRPDEQVLHVASTEVQEVETLPPTTITTTTTEPTTTPVPIRYCVVQRSHQPDQLIAEGKSRRLYILDDAECSELCTCGGGDSLALTCHALCVPLAPCRTALAYYSHAAPAYQAFRGRCLCYSGRFICMRPPPGEYQLPGGIFLLLGYSSTDEALLRPHTNLGVQDAVRALQQYVLQHIDNSTLCTLTLFNITEENIILSIRLPLDPKLTPMQLLKLEKDQCTRILEAISHQINTQYVELSAHRLLSIFKMAEVQIVWPEVSYARRHTTPSLVVSLMTGVATVLLTLCGTLVPPFVRWTQHHQRWPAASRLVT
uniref:GDNF/GAS1 domain-containing protein n=1 Tax=Anopheles funestus TaxID=62324 RepID=A0A1I8JU76_ANOFN